MDCGGYFIIKGSEKTVLGQERAAEKVRGRCKRSTRIRHSSSYLSSKIIIHQVGNSSGAPEESSHRWNPIRQDRRERRRAPRDPRDRARARRAGLLPAAARAAAAL